MNTITKTLTKKNIKPTKEIITHIEQVATENNVNPTELAKVTQVYTRKTLIHNYKGEIMKTLMKEKGLSTAKDYRENKKELNNQTTRIEEEMDKIIKNRGNIFKLTNSPYEYMDMYPELLKN